MLSMVSPPTQFLSEKIGFKELLSVTDMNYAYPNPAMATSGEMIGRKLDLIDRFMRAYVRGVHRAITDREFTIKSLAKYTTVTDAVLLSKTYDFYVGKVVERAPYMNMGGMQNAIDDLARTVPAAKTAKLEQFVDMRFLEKLEKSGLVNESTNSRAYVRQVPDSKFQVQSQNLSRALARPINWATSTLLRSR